MSDWKPKIGEECLALQDSENPYIKVKILHKANNGSFDVYACMTQDDGLDTGVLFWSADFKPLPTEEERLIDEFIKDYRYIAYPADCDFKEMAERIARAMLNKGYRKVKPISRDEFLKISRDLSVNLYGYLIDNNQIVVKGE